MKPVLKFSLIFAIFAFTISATWAQSKKPYEDPKYGKDSTERMECVKNLSIFSEYVKQKNYEDAYPAWKYCYLNAPKSSKNIYINGAKIIKYFIKQNKKNADKRNLYIDTLMQVFEQRMANFGQRPEVLGRMGVALLKWRKKDVEKAYGYLKESVELRKIKSTEAVLLTFMQATSGMFKAKKIEASEVVDNFIKSMDLLKKRKVFAEKKVSDQVKFAAFKHELDSLAKQITILAKDKKNNGEINKIKKHVKAIKKKNKNFKKLYRVYSAMVGVETLFTETKAGTCEELIPVFTPQFEADPTNVALLKKIIKFLDDCTGSELYAKVAEELYKAEPSDIAAYGLAKTFLKKQEIDKAIEYYENAIKLRTTEDEQKAKYYFQVASIYFMKKNLSKTRTRALQAAKARPSWGKPYILIAKAYASSGKTCNNPDNVDGKAVYWVAVDKLTKAKSVDSEVAAEANKLISQFKKQYPNNENCFMFGITSGQVYSVGCWIQEKTKVRFK